jgi:mxaJ protein
MCSPCRDLLVFAALMCAFPSFATEANSMDGANEPRVLKVVSDANNLPFSNEKQEGFENRIAELIARELHAQLQYTWRATRRGFMRESLKQGDCDITMASPLGTDRALTTIPYYRSTTVFVTRADRDLDIRTFDDPRLRDLKIGVQIVGDDGVNPAPAMALGQRGIVNNVVGYTVYGDYKEPNPPARILDAVAKGDVDIAGVWGPFAGYFAARSPVPLKITPVQQDDDPGISYAFDICVGVRKTEPQLRDEISAIIERNRGAIENILNEFHIPHVPVKEPAGREADHD